VEYKHALSKTSVRLHWLVAIIMIPMLALGTYMALFEVYDLYDIHKSIGVLVFPLLLARVLWRLKQGWPESLHHYAAIEQFLAKVTHWALLLGLIALPITGMIYSGASGHGFGIFGLPVFPANYHPTEIGQVIPYSEQLSIIGETAHEWIGYGLMVMLTLHIVGALKHHVIDGDGTLRRMLGKRV
jgi:cytochrome b561